MNCREKTTSAMMKPSNNTELDCKTEKHTRRYRRKKRCRCEAREVLGFSRRPSILTRLFYRTENQSSPPFSSSSSLLYKERIRSSLRSLSIRPTPCCLHCNAHHPSSTSECLTCCILGKTKFRCASCVNSTIGNIGDPGLPALCADTS
jgi:hypothetical protein